nr:receptor-like protein kinase HSL1 [Ipomoea trifida]
MTTLRRIDASMNLLAGTIPIELCELSLESLNLYENQLEGNSFSGEIAKTIAGAANLSALFLSKNRFSGGSDRKWRTYDKLDDIDSRERRAQGGDSKIEAMSEECFGFFLVFQGKLRPNLIMGTLTSNGLTIFSLKLLDNMRFLEDDGVSNEFYN